MNPHNLNTTTWLYDVDSKEVLKVIDQYRTTEEALSGAYRVMRMFSEEFQLTSYALITENIQIPHFLNYGAVGAIGVQINALKMGVLIPYAEIEGNLRPIIIENGKQVDLGPVAWNSVGEA